MSRVKSMLAVLMLAAIVSVAPQAHAQTLKVVIAGSSAMWQAMALGAYNNGTSIVSGGGTTFHYTSGANFNLIDNRSTVATVDNGATWIVWDSASPANVWAYVKVDSVVGNRCYFAAPKCVVAANGSFPAVGNSIVVWPDASADTAPPAAIQAVFTAGTSINVAATDIRPEDAAFAQCRVNSKLGASTAGGANSDKLDGLGYNVANNAGVCPVYAAATAQSKGVGTPIKSGYPGAAATDLANVLAFNLGGKDPITDTALPAGYNVISVGAAPIVFITAKTGALQNLHSATERQLQQVFSGTNCNASAFGLPAGPINVFLREPLSGTYNTTEATVMRYPTRYTVGSFLGSPVAGLSMETGVGATNPLAGTCAGGGGARYRAIGTGEEVKSVLNSNNASVAFAAHQDGIGFTFFSYGNVSSISNNAAYGYIALNGVDPIFSSYGAGNSIDPGQPAGDGVLPAQANLPAICATGFPCSENVIWGNGFSFPNLRNGTYRSWSLLRLVAIGLPSTDAQALATSASKYVVVNTPDYVPAVPVAGQVGTDGKAIAELGLKLVRSHYQQYQGNGILLGPFVTVADTCNVPERGGDMGGMIIPTTIGITTEKRCSMVQSSSADGTFSPAVRPGAIVQ